MLRLGMAAHVRKLHAGEAEIGISLGLIGQVSPAYVVSPGPRSDPISKSNTQHLWLLLPNDWGSCLDKSFVGFCLFGLLFAFSTARTEPSASVLKNLVSLQGHLNKVAGHMSQSNSQETIA